MFSAWTLVYISSFLIWPQWKTWDLVTRVQVSLRRMFPSGSGIDSFTDEGRSLLDLPELPLHLILDRLSPKGLYAIASVCNSLRNECKSDFYWEKHLKQKWGHILCPAVYKEWKCYISAQNEASSHSRQVKQKDWLSYILCVFPNYKRKTDSTRGFELKDSSMGLYLALENGKLWFPAQVYNREVKFQNSALSDLY